MLYAPKEKGQGLVEYALIIVLIAVVVLAILVPKCYLTQYVHPTSLHVL